MYEVIFETGSLKGKRWRIPDGGVIAIGRSHSCNIRPKEPDVSGKHAILREEGGVVWLEVLSSHKTAVDGIRLSVGEKVAITEVSQVTLGGGLAFRLGVASAGDETGEIMPSDTATLGTGTVATVATRAISANTATLGDDTGTLSGTVATAATRASQPNTATLGDDTGTLSGTVATAATRAFQPNTATLGDDSGTLDGTGLLKPAGASSRRARAMSGAKPPRPTADEGETQMVTGLETIPGSGGETTDLDSGGETQMLATQAVTPAEIEKLRGEHVRRQRRKIGLKSLLFAIVLGLVAGLYSWLSHPSVNPYLVAPSKISFNGIIKTEGGAIGVIVPNFNGGAPTYADEHQVRYETRLGDHWETPFTIVLTNYLDRQSLYESAEASFERWRKANMVGFWVDRGESDRRHIFLGGGNGEYPGIPCLQHNYSKVGEDRENISGTATFFRLGARCYVLLRELPSSEDGRGAAWLTEIWATLFVQEKLSGNVANLIVARHWEGTEEADAGESPAEIAKACREALKSGAQNKWERIRRRLYVAMRMLHGRNDADSAAVRAQVLDALQLLREEQREFWNRSALMANQYMNSTRDDAEKRLAEVTRSVETYFNVPDDERTWILGTEYWWLYHGMGE